MRKPEESVFPEEIDPLIFYQDASIERKPELAQYYAYLNENNFDAAKDYLAASTLDYYGAWLLNLIENRLYAIEDNMDGYLGEKPRIVIHSEKEPHNDIGIDDVSKFYNWTGNVSPFTITLDMEYYNDNPIDDVYLGQHSESIKIIITDEDGNVVNLRDLYNAITPEASFNVVGEFEYNSTLPEQTYVVPKSGWYKFEVWGGQGGVDPQYNIADPITESTYDVYSENLNKGGYATGVMYLEKNTTLYIHVGSQGDDTNGGYNGGGQGSTDSYIYTGYYEDYDKHSVFMIGSGGGGATHIALSSGELSDFENNLDDLIIVAGGGGGDSFVAITNYDPTDPTGYYHEEYYYNGGAGGGFIGGLGKGDYAPTTLPARDGTNLMDNIFDPNYGYYTCGWGGSQTWAGENITVQNADGLFGEGGSGDSLYYSTAGGGGGFYGGAASSAAAASGGGSGWIKRNGLSEKQMAIQNYDEGDQYKYSFTYYKQSDFDNCPDPDSLAPYYYNDFDLDDGSTTDFKMPTVSGYYPIEDTCPEANEHALGDGYVRISYSPAEPGVEPSDIELIEMINLTSSNEVIASITFDTGYYSDLHDALEYPRALITGKYMGHTYLKARFEHIRSSEEKCVVSSHGELCHNFYLSYNENVPLLNYPGMSDGKVQIYDYYDNDPVYIIKGATSQYSSDPSSEYYYNIFEYNGAVFDEEYPNIVSVDKQNTIHTLNDGTSLITLIPGEDFVGTGYYESGDFNHHAQIKVLDVNNITTSVWRHGASYSTDAVRSYEGVIFPSDDVVCVRSTVHAKCGDEDYSIITCDADSGYYYGIPMGMTLSYNISEDLEHEESYEGMETLITIPDEWNDETYAGGSFTVNITTNNLPMVVTGSQTITVAPYQSYVEYISGHDNNISLNAVGNATKLPLIVYSYDSDSQPVVIETPRFIPDYNGNYNNRIVDIDSYGNVVALREGTIYYRVYYNDDDYETFHFTVGS